MTMSDSETALTAAEFQAALQAAVSRRETQYANFFALHFHWEDDNTNAARDEKSFGELARYLGFNPPEIYIIPSRDHTWISSSIEDITVARESGQYSRPQHRNASLCRPRNREQSRR